LLQGSQLDRIEQFWGQRHDLLRALDHLPVCFCHHDAFRRNLLARNVAETVAIDWSYTGFGAVGEESGTLTWLRSPVLGQRLSTLEPVWLSDRHSSSFVAPVFLALDQPSI
jgi:hypothetical protein